VDGILFTGGLDVDPAIYGEAPHPATVIAEDRDRFEIPLTRAAVERDLPLLAICRGVQVLNVAAGGTLVQDIPSQTKTNVRHAVDEPKNRLAHAIVVAPESTLAKALGGAAPNDTCQVNSRHHQAIGRLAPDFVVSATSTDGIVEAIERPASRFCVGVQWHPENFVSTGEFAGLFDTFIAACTKGRHS
jgi:putative glutamine amidotransferase